MDSPDIGPLDVGQLKWRGTHGKIEWNILAGEAIPNPGDVSGYAAVGPRKGATTFLHPVRFAGADWPRHVRATWRREGLEVDMIVETDPETGPFAIWVSFANPEGLSSEHDRQTPWLSMAKDSARMLATGLMEPPRHARRITEEQKAARFRLVANLYREAMEHNRKHDGQFVGVNQFVHAGLWAKMPDLAVSPKRVSQLIWYARNQTDPNTGETYLGPTVPGKAGE